MFLVSFSAEAHLSATRIGTEGELRVGVHVGISRHRLMEILLCVRGVV
jgi:hypothetical protein